MSDFYSVMQDTDANVFAQIAKVYLQEGWQILDATCGQRIFWRNIDERRFKVTFNDLRPEVEADTHYDILDYPQHQFDAIVFDPPHLDYSDTSMFYRKYGSTRRLGRATRLDQLLTLMPAKLAQLLTEEGIVIAKLFDDRKNDQIQPYHSFFINEMLLRFDLIDLIIKSSIRQKEAQKGWHGGRKPSNHSIPAHSYYMIFQKR
jgi:hypothetical protein